MSAFVRIVDRQQFADHFATQGVQAEIARRVGISRARVNQLLHGKTTVSIRTAAAIETALGVPVGTLFQPDDAELLGRYLATSS
jgi:transcriptional regulator with XRE-family HTH domain